LSFDSASNVRSGTVGPVGLNDEGDLVFAWSDPFGGSWPGSTEAELATLTFNIAEGASGSTELELVKISTPPGYDFDGQSQQISITASVESQVIYTAEASIEGTTFELVDNTDYPPVGGGSVVTVPELQGSTQHIYVSESTKSADGSQVTVKLSYLVDDPSLTGVGFDLNFDSDVLSLDSVSDVRAGSVASGSLNDDGNALVFAWSDPFGGNWPGSTEAELATVTFNIAEGATGSTALDIVEVSTPPAYDFDGQSHEVGISSAPMSSHLSINSATGEVTLNGVADSDVVSEYNFTVIATNGDETASQDVSANIGIVAPSNPAESVVIVPELQADTQHVYVSESTKSEDGSQVTVKLSYLVDDPTLTGIGFDLNFDTSALSLDSVSGVAGGAFASGSLNSDGNGLNFGWADPFGGSWPGSTEAELATVTFNVAEGATGSAALDIVKVSTPPGYAFDGQSHDVIISVDVVTEPDPVSDPQPVLSELSINSATGEVTLNVDPDFEDVSEYSFEIVSSNDRNASGTAIINNLDEVAPTTTSGSDAGSVEENGAAQVVYSTAADDSGDISGGVTFSLADETGPFSIDATSGDVTFAGGADYESQSAYNFAVIATDAAGNASEAQSVTLDISNLDDVAPTVTSGSDAGSVDENGVAQVVYTAIADDSGDISDGVTFSLADDSDSEFSIDAASGEVTFAGGAEYESQSTYNFGVIATDAAANASEVQSVTLGISNLDEVAPSITSGPDAEAVIENGLAQIIYTATADDSGDISEGVTFSLTSGSDSAFSIDAVSGEVTFAGSADSEGQSSYNFEVIATDAAGNSSNPQSVSVPVEEQGFEITSGSVVSADENIGENQPVYITEVLGTEQGDVITYSLPESSADAIGGFDQRFVKNDDGSITLQIYVSDTVSANYQDGIENFDLTLSYDASEISDVDLSVTSGATFSAANEIATGEYAIAALFFPNLYAVDSPLVELTFNLSAGIPSTSFKVSDGFINEDVAYLDQSVSSYYNNNGFTINESTGEVSLIENPDHETRIDYVFSVMATNTTTNETAVQSVNLQINDLDDFKPVITSGEIEDSVDENSGAQVIYIATADDSGDISDGFTFALTGSDAGAFSIDENSGVVTLVNDPDFEAKSEYNFAVIAIDAAGNASDPKELTLSVNNLDDTAPTIISGPIANVIDENSGEGQVIYTVLADDSADVSVGETTFGFKSLTTQNLSDGPIKQTFIEDPSADGFYIMQLSLSDTAIETLEPIGDAKAIENFDLIIGFDQDDLDLGSVSYIRPDSDSEFNLPSSALLADNSGIAISQIFFNPSMPVNSTTVIGSVKFKLKEGVDSAQFDVNRFSVNADQYLVNPDDDAMNSSIIQVYTNLVEDMRIDENTGEVTLLTDPDFEQQNQYSFDVVAMDSVGNVSDTQSVTLNINNQDDVAPTINSGSDASSVDENGTAQVVYTATADDSGDISEGVTFSLANSGDSSSFTIDAVSGEVTFAGGADYEGKAEYSFSVIATDAAGNVSDPHAVTMQVTNVDEVGPSITSASEAESIFENSGAGQMVYTALAVDTDYNGEEIIQYRLDDSSDDVFSINAETGEVTLNADPDYEAKPIYSFSVIAIDGSGNEGQSQTVSLSIEDVDDFTQSGAVYHWASRTLMEDVAITMVMDDGSVKTDMTDDAGHYHFDQLPVTEFVLTAEKDIQAQDARTISSRDSFAALQMAVGMNPNETVEFGQEISMSPYQLIAADVNKSGKVTSADAVLLLKTAVGMDSFVQEWMFIDESEVLSTYKDSVFWDSDGIDHSISGDQSTNLVGVLLGDVFSNWTGPEGAQTMPMPTAYDDSIISPESFEDDILLDHFESGEDSIDLSAILTAAGYTDDSSLAKLSEADISDDILDLVSVDDSSLDNLFGGFYDEDTNVLTIFADTDSEQGVTQVESMQIQLSEDSTIDEDDITATSFIA
jgi:hypothetical protein